MIQLGKLNTLTISRKSDFGLFLKDERNTEILLPNAYVTPQMKIGDTLEVFIYHDSEDRLTATTQHPKAMLDEFSFFEVVDTAAFGAFVSWGLPKDLLVPKKHQKEPFRIGEKKLLRIIYDEKTHRLIGTEKIAKYISYEPKGYVINKPVKTLIIKETPLGYKAIVDDKHEGLLYKNETFETIEIGNLYTTYVKKRRHDGKLDLSIKKIGAKKTKSSQEKILTLLKKHKGKLPYNYKSNAEEIQSFFTMSKKEFKRTLTLLQEKNIIMINEKGITLL